MLIILVAHIPGNGWTLWIPARFGFSDATEIFVFSSGMASAMAFGAVFAGRGWLLGAARIAHRVWQVYWAHIGVFLTTAMLLAAIEATGVGDPERNYLTRPFVLSFFTRTEEALVGLMTLTYVPGLFDILPMYLVILAMIPAVMALHAVGGPTAAAAFVAVSWSLATLAGVAHRLGEDATGHIAVLAAIGEPLRWMNPPSSPWGQGTWFFNPFAWQLIFFTGFAFGMGWLRPPAPTRARLGLAAAVVVGSLPLAWFRLHGGELIPGEGGALEAALKAGRDAIEPLRWKTWFGLLRYLHFLALAYLAWAAVGEMGRRLAQPLPLGRADAGLRRRRARVAGALAVALAPYALASEIKAVAPWLDAALLAVLPAAGRAGLGWAEIVFAAALATAVYNAAPPAALARLGSEGWAWLVRTLRKVGSQSLAVFMTSIPLSQLCGLALDHLGRDLAPLAFINLTGMACLVLTAHAAAWFKGQPWRQRATAAAPAPAE